MSKQWNIQEVSFPVPWGIIAGKSWGDPCASPVIVLHGIQDNAGSFDSFIPHLPRCFYYLCLDIPGHGLSSRFPKGFRMDFVDCVLSVQRVVRQLKWKTYIVMGHSLGGQLTQYYAAMFPDQVQKIVVLDAYGPLAVEEDELLHYHRKSLDEILSLEEKMLDSNPPSYTYEQALEKAIQNRRSPITREAAERLLPRNLKKGKDGYYFSLDQRLKFHVMSPITFEGLQLHYSKIRCPFLLLMTKRLHEVIVGRTSSKDYRNFFSVFETNPKFRMVLVDGVHDVHNISPEVMAPYVSEFLLKQESHL